jgi:hypothetical protein
MQIRGLKRSGYDLASHAYSIFHGAKFTNPCSLQAAFNTSSKDGFILCPGASVDSLSSKQFEVFSKGTSVGINSWALHPFKPDYLLYEPSRTNPKDLLAILQTLPELPARSKALIPYQGLWARGVLEKLVTGNRLLYYVPRMMGESESIAVRNFENLLGQGELVGSKTIFGTGASVIRALSLLAHIGCKRIVLVGLDFSDQYFSTVSKEKFGVEKVNLNGVDSAKKVSLLGFLKEYACRSELSDRLPKLYSLMPESNPLTGTLPKFETDPPSYSPTRNL